MNKKDIANIRKQLKIDNELLKIKEIFTVYVKKESGEIYHYESQPFSMLEMQPQELYINNFKKILTGNLDAKLFELKFKTGINDSMQDILYKGLNVSSVADWKDEMLKVVERMFAESAYTYDVVVTFAQGEYRKPKKKRSKESDEGGNDEVFANQFILSSINKTDQPKKALMFDYTEKEFKSNSVLDPIINLTSPLTGFMFPAFNNNSADVNHILYSAGKTNHPDSRFIDEVLDCEEIITAQEDKESFEKILKKVIGKKVDSTTIANVYEQINKMVVESEDGEDTDAPMLDVEDIERILQESGVKGVDSETVEHAFKDIVDHEGYELKSSSLIPNYTSKSIKINTKIANVAVSPKELKHVKHITHNGKRCLLIEIDEDAYVEGFELKSESM